MMSKAFQPIRVAFAVVILLSAARLSGQVKATGTFAGQVTDAAGAAVPNAQVKVTDQAAGTSVTRTTGNDGYYITPSRCSNPACTRSKPAPKGSAPPWRKISPCRFNRW